MDIAIIKKIVIDLFKIDDFSLPEADVMTFACDNDRYIDFEDKKYSPLIDTITDDLASNSLKVVSISRIASMIKGSMAYGDVYSPDGAFARALILKRLKSLVFRNGKYPFSNAEASVWEKIIDKVKPKVVIGIMPSRELCAVCYRNNIPVYDIQHGVISKEHPWYNPSSRSVEPIEWLPNVLCWDTDAVNTILSWGRDSIKAVHTGNPWINRFIMDNGSDLLVNKLKVKYRLSDLFKSNKPKILISVSWGNYNIPDQEFISKELESFILNNADKYEFVMRLHPNMLSGFATDEGSRFFKYYERCYSKLNIDWQQSTSMPLPLLLSNIDLHITWNSSVIIEAAIMGKPSLSLDNELLDGEVKAGYYTDQVESGLLCKARSDYSNIASWVESTINKPVNSTTKPQINYKLFVDSIVDICRVDA